MMSFAKKARKAKEIGKGEAPEVQPNVCCVVPVFTGKTISENPREFPLQPKGIQTQGIISQVAPTQGTSNEEKA